MLRVAFYCHDTYGLGHLQRCLKLASAFSRSFASVEGLILTGSPWQAAFRAPTGFRLVGLPPVKKEDQGAYVSRIPDLDLRTTLALRRARIDATLEAFRPDLLIVDNVPCGLAGEILPALRRYRGRDTVAVLALRDILDRPEAILEEWTRAGAAEPLEELYDEIWVFGGDGDLCRLIAFGPLASVAAKVHCCGYVGYGRDFGAGDARRTWAQGAPASTRGSRRPGASSPRSRPMVLITGGGGGDAFQLIRTYLATLDAFRPNIDSRVVLGPDFPRADRDRLPRRGGAERVELLSFTANLEDRIAGSDVVISMAGYNTVCEILATGRPALLVPRVYPREEQSMRAARWRRAGRMRMIHPDVLSPSSLWRGLEELIETAPHPPMELPGGRVAAARVASLMGFEVQGA